MSRREIYDINGKIPYIDTASTLNNHLKQLSCIAELIINEKSIDSHDARNIIVNVHNIRNISRLFANKHAIGIFTSYECCTILNEIVDICASIIKKCVKNTDIVKNLPCNCDMINIIVDYLL